MARRSFSKRVTRKLKRIIKQNELQNIIEREFIDSHNNKVQLKFDFNPHNFNEPTFRWQRQYGDNE